MPVAKYHNIIVIGSAIIYRIRFVKLKRRNILPAKPQAKEAALSPMHLVKISCAISLSLKNLTSVGRGIQSRPRRPLDSPDHSRSSKE